MKKTHIILLEKSKIINSLKLFSVISLLLTLSIVYFTNISKVGSLNAYSGVPLQQSDKPAGKIAIVIDDFGQDRNGVKEMMSINRHLTFAVMPFLTYSQSDAKDAFEKGFEVIVHLPMEPVSGKISWLGPKPILSTLSDTEVYEITSEALTNVPYAVGANIHMGSKISTNDRIMSDVLDIIKQNGIYFLDSKTSAKSVAKKIAAEKAVAFYERNVFLDGQTSKEHVKEQLRKAGAIALKDGKSIAIGHVGIEGGKVTAQAIIEMLPEFDEKNIQLVFVSELEN
ncbi:divergent polysaccharide deacetylase family protein [Acetivibrio cellulolyticus]|uniref:divergent polysaccharide deacetylase family protein n=1 Tax=Acetivibrio cellulolyticus TaxID=35830 RepID=UPI0001E2E2C1|nr:divergent polysaccharide deacetylase family protein [Acetivibrio cellulolyticus]